MTDPKFRADYADLEKIAARFGSEADAVVKMFDTMTTHTTRLRDGAWVGKAATAFYAEMDSTVLPSVRRLWHALSEGKVQTLRLKTLIKQAEDDAARVLRDTDPGARGIGTAIGTAVAGPLGAAIGGAVGAAIDAVTGTGAPRNPGDVGFDAAAGGVKPITNAPGEMRWPQTMNDGMNDAWGKSFPNGLAQEQGGVLVRTADGKYEFRSGAAGNTGSFSPNYDAVKPGETLVADAHTHPYDVSEGGHTNVSFSGQDLGRLAVLKDVNMSVMQSGEGKFAIVRTKEFDALVASKGDRALMNEMKTTFNTEMRNANGTFAERNEAATRAVAKKYNLAYYHGTGDTLARVNP